LWIFSYTFNNVLVISWRSALIGGENYKNEEKQLPDRRFLPGTAASSINTSEQHDRADIFMKVALNTNNI
jgi:hypothetical protein